MQRTLLQRFPCAYQLNLYFGFLPEPRSLWAARCFWGLDMSWILIPKGTLHPSTPHFMKSHSGLSPRVGSWQKVQRPEREQPGKSPADLAPEPGHNRKNGDILKSWVFFTEGP